MAKDFWKKEIILTRKKLLVLAVIFFVLAGVASGFFLNHVFPRLAGIPGLDLLTPKFTVVVNRTEEVKVVDNLETRDIYDQARRTTVTVFSFNAGVAVPSLDALTPNRQGAGAVMTSDGLIFTTKSVVGKSNSSVFVMLDDGSVHRAAVASFDPRSELAAVKIQVQNLPVMDIEPADKLLTGEKVVVVGGASTPFGAPMNVSAVEYRLYASAQLSKSRSTEEASHYLALDADLGSEFIGGSVSNRQKHIVGLVTTSGVLPGEYLRAALERFLDEGRFIWPEVGLSYIFVLPPQAQMLGYQESYGFLINAPAGELAVQPGSPASKAGLMSGDFIVKLNDRDIAEQTFAELLATARPGDTISIVFMRDGARKTVTLTTGESL